MTNPTLPQPPIIRVKRDEMRERLKIAAKDRQATTNSLARHFGIPPSTMHRMLTMENYQVSTETMAMVLNVLPGVAWEELFELVHLATGDVITRITRDGVSEDAFSHGYRTGYRNGVNDGIRLVKLEDATRANVR